MGSFQIQFCIRLAAISHLFLCNHTPVAVKTFCLHTKCRLVTFTDKTGGDLEASTALVFTYWRVQEKYSGKQAWSLIKKHSDGSFQLLQLLGIFNLCHCGMSCDLLSELMSVNSIMGASILREAPHSFIAFCVQFLQN